LFERALNLGGGHNDIKVGDIVLLRENGTAHTLAKIVELFMGRIRYIRFAKI